MSDDAAHAPTERLDPSTPDPSTAATTGGPRRASHESLVAGEVLGARYEITGVLGQGGMGTVYRARDRILGADVALKVVRGELAGQIELRDEVRVAQRVTHPNVCRIYDLEDIDGRHLVKMELVDGETLAARIARGPLPITAIVEIARAIASGLAAAHAHGIVHRDLKPGNVMLRDGAPVLMDFGIARAVADGVDERAGTPGYMSPEQLAGSGVDERSDLYALGCLVYEMLVGARLFEHRSSMTELAVRQAAAPAPAVRARRRDTPRWLARAVSELLARDPAIRPRGARRLARGPRARRVALAAVAIVAVAGGLAWWQIARRPFALSVAPPPAASWVAKVESLGEVYDHEHSSRFTFSNDGTTIAFPADRHGTGDWRLFLWSVAKHEKTAAFAIASEAPPEVRYRRDGRGMLIAVRASEVYHLTSRDDRGAIEDLGAGNHDPDDCGDAIVMLHDVLRDDEMDGQQLVTVDKATRAITVLATAPPFELFDHPRCDRAGARLVVARTRFAEQSAEYDILLVDRSTRAATVVARGASPVLTPDGLSIVFGRNGLFELVLADRSEHVVVAADAENRHVAPAISPDGKLLAYQRVNYTTAVFGGTIDDRQGRPLDAPLEHLGNLTFMPDGKHVVGERHQPDAIVVIATAPGEDQRDLVVGRSPFPSRDGASVYFTTHERRDQLRVVPFAGGAARVVATFPGPVIDGVEAADGIHVLVGGTPVDRHEGWRVVGGQAARESELFQIPAPRGPWRIETDLLRETVVSAPGHPARELECDGPPRWLDATHVGCHYGEASYAAFDVAAAELVATPLVELAWGPGLLAVAPDGKHWIALRDAPHAARLMITNFDERPWRP